MIDKTIMKNDFINNIVKGEGNSKGDNRFIACQNRYD